ncbi:MAG: Gfo/Idh/MocA family oxidoreductase [Rhodospirillaceae bacterium]
MTLSAAIVGLGVGEQHARAFAALGNCRVKWLFDLDRVRAERLAAQLGQGQAADSYGQILADPDVQIVSLASYDDHHFAEVGQAFSAGKHVFVEKPLCRTEPEVQSLKAAWEQAGRPHLRSNLVLRGAPVYRWLTDAVAAGEFGDVYAFDGDYLYGRMEKITEGWRKDVDDYSVMEGGGIHIIDLMLGFLGGLPDRVEATGNKVVTASTAYRYDDFAAATFHFPSGAIGRITANFGCVHPHHHIIRLYGTKATFIYDDRGPRVFRKRHDGAVAEPLSLAPLPEAKGVLIPDFAAAIEAGADPASAAEREFDLVRVVAAADRARLDRQPQNL